ncbi:hypothetical protein Tsp_01816 [Trichinella spiralis]|uniref:hypothetical protein n=1 Tax=Trichinella spiralis TaxID=6334 RepID=UPI0001EFCE9B|nr:hypothetical protein Tsp_01816 [Trichinella spiralis]
MSLLEGAVRYNGACLRNDAIGVPRCLPLPAPGFSSGHGLLWVAREAGRLFQRQQSSRGDSDHGVVARYLLNGSVHRELYPAGQARENSFEEFKKRLLGTYAPEELTGQLTSGSTPCIKARAKPSNNTPKRWQRAGVSERDLVARGITSKQAYMVMRLQEPSTLAEARKLVKSAITHLQPKTGEGRSDPVHRQLDTRGEEDFPEAGKAGADGCSTRRKKRRLLLSGGLGYLRHNCPHERCRTQRLPTGTQSGGPGTRRVLSMAGLQADEPCVNDHLRRRALGEGDGGDTACGWSTNVHQQSGGGAVATGPLEGTCVSDGGVLGTNFFDSLVRTVDWQTQEMTMMDGSKVRIEHDPTWAGQPSIGCAVVAKPQGVGFDAEAGADGPDDWTRTQVDGAECSAQSRRVLRSILWKCGKAILRGDADLGRTSLVKHRIETRGAQPM